MRNDISFYTHTHRYTYVLHTQVSSSMNEKEMKTGRRRKIDVVDNRHVMCHPRVPSCFHHQRLHSLFLDRSDTLSFMSARTGLLLFISSAFLNGVGRNQTMGAPVKFIFPPSCRIVDLHRWYSSVHEVNSHTFFFCVCHLLFVVARSSYFCVLLHWNIYTYITYKLGTMQ